MEPDPGVFSGVDDLDDETAVVQSRPDGLSQPHLVIDHQRLNVIIFMPPVAQK